jgi:hypothetical protein
MDDTSAAKLARAGTQNSNMAARRPSGGPYNPLSLNSDDAIHLAALLQAGGPAYGAFACWEGDLRVPPAGSLQARSSLTALVSKAVSER